MDYLKNFTDRNLLAFRPTGWAKNTKPQYGSRVSIVGEFFIFSIFFFSIHLVFIISFRIDSGVQYSEHSSFSELERFVRFVQPEKVISTVPISSANQETKNVPTSWLTGTKPMRTSQRTVTSFLKIRKNSSLVVSDKTIASSGTSQRIVRDDAGSYDSFDTDYMP